MKRVTKRIFALAASSIVAFGVAAAAAPVAAAVDCSSSHCYGLAALQVCGSSGILGISGAFRTNCMTVPNYSANLASHEMWYIDPTQRYWVEAGITVGTFKGQAEYSPFVFWADFRPNNTYNEWLLAGYTLGTYTNIRIEKASAASTSISIYGGSTAVGTSTSNFSGVSQYINAGDETNTSSVHTFGSISSLSYKTLESTWHAGRNTSTLNSSLLKVPSSGGPYGTVAWVTANQWMQVGAGASC